MVSAVDVEQWSFLKIAPIKTNNKTWISEKVSTKRLSPGETDGAARSREQADVQTGGRAVHRSRCVIFQYFSFILLMKRGFISRFSRNTLFSPKRVQNGCGHYLSTNKPLLSNRTISEIEDKLET